MNWSTNNWSSNIHLKSVIMLGSLQKIQIEKPVDKIIKQIKTLISNGEIKPGDKLPPERVLAEHLGVGRSQVREAIQKLEFYGILRTYPQSGTFVSGIGIIALEGLISDIVNLEEHDFHSLIETRVLLEKEAAFLAATRRTQDDIASLKNAIQAYDAKINQGLTAVEEDLLFHIKIAEASKNNVLKSLMMIITPDILKNYVQLKACKPDSFNKAMTEHHIILQHIVNQEPKLAAEAMELHLMGVIELSKQIKKEQ